MPANLDAMVQSVHGDGDRLASREDISARDAREGGTFLRAAGLVPTDEGAPHSAAVTF